MVYGVLQTFVQALKYRGGWRGLLEHMYTNSDFPFKFGTYMGCDAAGNRYYENRVDYPLGQHRWIEPADIHNYDSSQIPPEWHGWMTHMNDATPTLDQEHIDSMMANLRVGEISHAPFQSNTGHQEPYFNFHHMHNQSQIRSRGYMIGNHVVGLPPGAPDAYYTQPGSPYNPASIRKRTMIGELTGGRKYRSEMWKQRLMTKEEKEVETKQFVNEFANGFSKTPSKRLTRREQAILERGGTIAAA